MPLFTKPTKERKEQVTAENQPSTSTDSAGRNNVTDATFGDEDAEMIDGQKEGSWDGEVFGAIDELSAASSSDPKRGEKKELTHLHTEEEVSTRDMMEDLDLGVQRMDSDSDTSQSSISSLLIRPDRRPKEPFKTRMMRLFAWQLLLSLLACLPILFFGAFGKCHMTSFFILVLISWPFFAIKVPVFNIVAIPLLFIFLVVLFYNISFLSYLTLAQTDPPAHVRLPFLPYDLRLCIKVNMAVLSWLGIGLRIGPKIVSDWCVRRVTAVKDRQPDWIRLVIFSAPNGTLTSQFH